MKVLIVNYYYSPMREPHAYRWEKIAKFWAGEGKSINVISGAVCGAHAREIKDGIRITRVGIKRKGKQAYFKSKAGKETFRNIFSATANSFLKKIYRAFYWPDGLWHWFPFALLRAINLNKKDIDLVVSYSPTFSAHLVVLLLKTFTRRSNWKWIADYGDPFSISETMRPNNFSFYRRLNHFVERLIIAKADSVVFTNIETANAYKQYFKYESYNLGVIPHLIDLDELYNKDTLSKQSESGTVSIVYLGAFHRGIREPGKLIDLAKRLWVASNGRITLHIYGPDNGFDLSSQSQAVVYHGMVSRGEAIELMRGADVLVNVGNENCVMVPSKLVECIASGRPLLNIGTNGEGDELIKQYERLGMAYNAGNKSTSIIEAEVLSFIMHKYSCTCNYQALNSILVNHRLDTVASSYLERIAGKANV